MLGSAAAGVPEPGNAGSGYLVQAGGDAIMLDCGNGVLGNLLRHVDDHDAVDAVCMSHLHMDHALDLLPLALRFKFYDAVLPVHGPARLAELLEAWFPLFSDNPQAYLDALAPHAWEPREAREVAGFRVTPVPVEHGPEAYALRVERDGSTLCYSGDTTRCEGLVEAARGADVLLCEAAIPPGVDWEDARESHMTPTEAGEVAREAEVGELVLTHLLYDADRGPILEAARDAFGGRVSLAEPNRTLRVRAG